ncbi:hypothetical protein QQF64_028044 [Cirrhinus molitorella]|uniref:Uncharacterized protein n=1 Tax=Cirrhinus molitorella TaxID=172907 RepID=A0ABR3N5S7_9TELE
MIRRSHEGTRDTPEHSDSPPGASEEEQARTHRYPLLNSKTPKETKATLEQGTMIHITRPRASDGHERIVTHRQTRDPRRDQGNPEHSDSQPKAPEKEQARTHRHLPPDSETP